MFKTITPRRVPLYNFKRLLLLSHWTIRQALELLFIHLGTQPSIRGWEMVRDTSYIFGMYLWFICSLTSITEVQRVTHFLFP